MLSLGGCPDVQIAYQDSVALARQQKPQREHVKQERERNSPNPSIHLGS